MMKSSASGMALLDSQSVVDAVQRVDMMDPNHPRTLAVRRVVMRRARELGCQHEIPMAWLRQRAEATTHDQQFDEGVAKVCEQFALKAAASGLPDSVLRTAYMRGVRDYAMTSPHGRPPLTRDMVAQARVNALIRFASGDDTARSDDADLIEGEGQ